MTIKKTLSAKARAFVPVHINNTALLGFLDFLRKRQRLFGKRDLPHYKKNIEAIRHHVAAMEKKGGYIEDQHSYKDVAFGAKTVSYSGCEIIAMYNTLVFFRSLIKDKGGDLARYKLTDLIHPQEVLADLVRQFELDGMILSGRMGASPQALRDHLRKRGFETELIIDPLCFDERANKHDCSILVFYNDGRDVLEQIHTACITKDSTGRFWAHNFYCNGRVCGPCSGVSELLEKGTRKKGKKIALIGISLGDKV